MYDRRELDLKAYYPDFLKEFEEFGHIAGQEKQEVNALYDKCTGLWADGFIQTAGWQGIKKWESLLGIRADQKLSLQDRRDLVLAKWNNQLPYTEEKLREKLTALLGDDYVLSIINQEYKLELMVKERTQEVVNGIKDVVNEMVPANLMTEYASVYQEGYTISIKYNNTIHFRTGFYPRYNLPFLKLDNTWKLDGSRKLNGYKSDARLDFYPVSLQIQALVQEKAEIKERLRLFSGAREEISLSAGYKVQTEARASPASGNQFSVKTEVKECPEAGSVRVMNLNKLDNQWKLDGSRKLNGGLSFL